MNRDYSKMRITELKNELRIRRLQFTGIKYLLINRLKLDDARKADPDICEININFSNVRIASGPLLLNPHKTTFRDIKLLLRDKYDIADNQKIFVSKASQIKPLYFEPDDKQLVSEFPTDITLRLEVAISGKFSLIVIQLVSDINGKFIYNQYTDVFMTTIRDIKKILREEHHIDSDFNVYIHSHCLRDPILCDDHKTLSQCGILSNGIPLSIDIEV